MQGVQAERNAAYRSIFFSGHDDGYKGGRRERPCGYKGCERIREPVPQTGGTEHRPSPAAGLENFRYSAPGSIWAAGMVYLRTQHGCSVIQH